ncbi:MAG: bifunctional riboflavin kinase/FAD synthetase [Methylohalobius sp.]|nr:bifunctional riboflavin kinase/FAD synthetase [Methylohalobius sp.]
MRLILGLHRPPPPGTVATIGNFDGVHLGHQHLIRTLARQGERLGWPVTVVLFEPQPLEYFLRERAPARLTRLREKLARMADLPVDQVLLLRFEQKLAALAAWDFIEQVLAKGLGVRYLVVGEDFRFGRNREGDFALLEAAGVRYGFEVSAAPTFELSGMRVSSTRIRKTLEQGDLTLAGKMLGRPYSMCGRVVAGSKRGKAIGFPTANLDPRRRQSPIYGVFAVTVQGVADKPWPGVANVGIRPTVEKSGKVWLEVHLFDFQGDLYGRYLEVFFHHKLRQEKRFASLAELSEQIRQDAALARKLLNA